MNPDLSSAPYFDDYNDSKNFSKILFRPDRAVQARELNQMQTLFQKQVSRFGDNIFKQGSVVSGCHVTTLDSLPYVKVGDMTTAGTRADVTKYKQLYVRNAANTVAVILDTSAGFENRAPDLNTMFVRYINSGTDGMSTVFNANEVLTVYNPSYEIRQVNINNGSSGYTNGDTLSFIPALSVTNTTGGNTFAGGIFAGDIISNGVGANVAVASVSYVGSTTTLTVRPIASDLNSSNTAAWNLTSSNFVDANTGQAITVAKVLGSGAAGKVVTNGNGTIVDTTLTSTGTGYSVAPTVVVQSTTASATQRTQTAIVAQNFVEQVTVGAPITSPIGVGFGVTVDEGTIYQSESFTRTDKQFVVVSKYSATPSDLVVGFISTTDIVTYLQDGSLVDNASGFSNAVAPGADRLRITAKPVVLTTGEAAARTDFVSLVEFSEGQPFKSVETSAYNVIADAIAQRTYEQSGNFVTDPFLVNVKSPAIANEPTTASVVVDPGTAYISGYRVATDRNYVTSISKAITTSTAAIPTNVDYGNYVICSDAYGVPAIDSIVQLQNAAYVAVPGSAITLAGTNVGQARIRGIKVVGNQTYVYLYDVVLGAGQTFASVASIGNAGLTFVYNVDKTVPTTLLGTATNRAIFTLPANATRHVTNLSYTYQKAAWGSPTTTAAGYVTLTVSGTELFPVAGPLSSTQLAQVVITPVANIVSSTALTGTVATTAGSNTITGTGTAFANVALNTFVSIGNTLSNTIAKVVAVTNATSLVVTPAPTIAYAGANINPAAPRNVPIRLVDAIVSPDRLTLTANIGFAATSANVAVLTNVVTTPTIASKSVQRDAAVRIQTSNNIANTVGPWCLGQSNIIRLKGVYIGANTTFLANTAGIIDATADFYIDANHTPELSDLGYLYQKPAARNPIASTSFLLVVYDVLKTSSTEVVTADSYPIQDGVALPLMSTVINTVELPEINGPATYFDARDSLDFRPFVSNTVAIVTTQATAPLNPAEPTYAAKISAPTRFPAPDTIANATVEYYLGRNDVVVATSNGTLATISGQPGSVVFPERPASSITINNLVIPPYPSLPSALSAEMAKIVDTKIASEKYSNRRNTTYTIKTTYTASEINEQQPKRYQMSDIGKIDRRMTAVEYSLSLSLAELQTSNRNITSANSPTTDRFKFGFFVDSFSDDTRSDITNPQFNTTIVNGVVQPKTLEYALSLQPQDADTASGGIISLPYNSTSLISQLGSTDGQVIPPVVIVVPEPEPVVIPAEPEVIPPPVVIAPAEPVAPVVVAPAPEPTPTPVVEQPIVVTPQPQPEVVVPVTPTPVVPIVPPVTTGNTTATVVTQTIETFIGSQKSTQRDKGGNISEIYNFVLSATDGPIRLLMNFKDNQNAIEVFQTSDANWVVPGQTTEQNLVKYSLAVTDWSASDRATFTMLDIGDQNGKNVFESLSNTRNYQGDANHRKPTFEDCGKIEWQHSAAGGQYYTIRITKYKGNGTSFYYGKYKFAFIYPKDYSKTVTLAEVPLTINYNGKFSSVSPNVFSVGSYTDAQNQVFYSPPQVFDLVVNGLKPTTLHTVRFDNLDYTSKAQQVGKVITAPLISGEDGALAFKLYYDGNTAAGLSEYEQQNAIANLLAGTKVISVSDGNQSFAYATIEPKSYVSNVSTASTPTYAETYLGGRYSLPNQNVQLV